jgi:hypothetical protein
LPWQGPARYEKRIINDRQDLEVTRDAQFQDAAISVSEHIDGPSVCLLSIQAGPQ